MSGWEGFRLVTKIKKLKAFIKDWTDSQFGSVAQSLDSHLLEIQQVDIKEESGSISPEDYSRRLLLKLSFKKKVREEEIKWRQRSRLRWLLEGDRNSKFFHSYASFRHKSNKIVVLMDGDQRREDKDSISNHIIQFIKSLYQKEAWNVLRWTTYVLMS